MPNAKLIFLGQTSEFSYQQKMEALVEKLKLADNIEFAGHTNNVASYLQRAKAHILPSDTEGFPMVLFEAKSFGVPSVLTAMPYLEATRDEDGCIMCGKKDVKGLAEGILKLLTNNDYQREMSARAVKSLEGYKTEDTIAKWQKLIKAVEKNRVAQEFEAEYLALDKASCLETMFKEQSYLIETISQSLNKKRDKRHKRKQRLRYRLIKKIQFWKRS